MYTQFKDFMCVLPKASFTAKILVIHMETYFFFVEIIQIILAFLSYSAYLLRKTNTFFFQM